MKLSQMIVQGLWENKSPLLQLPHMNEQMLRHFVTKRVRSVIFSIGDTLIDAFEQKSEVNHLCVTK